MTVYEIVRKNMEALRRGDQAEINRVLRIAKIGRGALEREITIVQKELAIKAALTKGDLTPGERIDLNRIERLEALKIELNAYAKRIGDSAKETTRRAISEGVKQGAKDAEHTLEVIIEGSFNALPTHVLQTLSSQLSTRSPLHRLFQTFGPGAAQAGRRALVEGITLGKNPRDIARNLRQVANIAPTRALTIVRTEHARAYNMATMQTYEANRDVIAAGRRVSARDDRTCYICWALDGQIIPLGSDIEMHPNCRCAILPVIRGDAEEADEKLGSEIFAERAEADPSWAKDLLGPARFDLYDSGKASLLDMVKRTYSPDWGGGVGAKNLEQIQSEIDQGRAGKTMLRGYDYLKAQGEN